jgi:signal transduction histidine kinase
MRRTESWLATARLLLAACALVAAWMDPTEIRSVWGYALLDFYVIHAIGIAFLLRSKQQTTVPFRLLVHSADIVWPAVISLFTIGQGNPFFLFFFFAIAAAAYRWGAWETLLTAIASLSLLWLESLSFQTGSLRHINVWLTRVHLSSLSAEDFDPKRLFMRSVYLVVIGLLLGYLAEQQKKLRAEKDEGASMLRMVRLDEGLSGTLSRILGQLVKMYGAGRALIASREGVNQKVWVGSIEDRGVSELQWLDAGSAGMDTYLGESHASSWFVTSSARESAPRLNVTCLNADGVLLKGNPDSFIERFAQAHPFRRMFVLSFSFGAELTGRLFLLEPQTAFNVEEELLFLQNLVRQIGPSIYNLYLLRRLRRRAGALERARLVRELHDGAVQSLIGVEMQVDVLRRSYPMAASVAGELDRIQQLLRNEVMNLRELMYQMKSSDIDARKLPSFLRDTVQRFQRETGISAGFLMDDEPFALPQSVCRELALIAQEALMNVRKHSGATSVSVHLLEAEGRWELIVEDDGAGFPFAGRVSQKDLDAAGRAPAIIRERVRLINGELTIESRPGRGSRLEVRVPQAAVRHAQAVSD